jgi:hypothetical protein
MSGEGDRRVFENMLKFSYISCMDMIELTVKKDKPPYLLGLLCLIPFIGAFVGLGLLLYGIVRYKDTKLIIIGAAGIVWTILVYGGLFILGSSFKGGAAFEGIAKQELNTVVAGIEFYKLEYGRYPDSLEELGKVKLFISYSDPMEKGTKFGDFQYKKYGDKYTVFSVGADGIAGTEDEFTRP